MYESQRLGVPISREQLNSSESPSVKSSSSSPLFQKNNVSDEDKPMNSDRKETEREEEEEDEEGSDVEVEIVGDTKKVYVYSPVFTKEDEELYRFVSSRVQDVEENDDDDMSSSISSTDSLEGASKPSTQEKGDKHPVKSHSKSNNRKNNEFQDSLDNNWADPPRLEDVTSAVPPLELRDVETPSKPREKKSDSHRKKASKKKTPKLAEGPLSTSTDNQSTPTVTAPTAGTAFVGGIPSTFVPPMAFPGAPPGGGIVYIAAPGSFGPGGGSMPIPFPFLFPNQMMQPAGGATITEVHERKSNESDETLTEQPPSNVKQKHHTHKHKKEKDTRDVGEMTTPDNATHSHQNSLLSSGLHGSATLPSGSSRDLYGDDEYYYDQNKKYGSVESPWTGGDQFGHDEYLYDKTESGRSNSDQQGQGKVTAAKPFGNDATSLPLTKIPNNYSESPSRKLPQQPLPFRRNDVDYVQANKRNYGRLKGSSYGQVLERRKEDKSVTDMIEEERMRIRIKVEQKAAELRRLKGGKSLPTGQTYQDDLQEYDESFNQYDPATAETYGDRFPSHSADYYDEQQQYYTPQGSSAESGWQQNVEKLMYAQEKKAALRRANDSALAKTSSAPGNKGAPVVSPAQKPPIGPPGSNRQQAFVANNQLSALAEEPGPNRYRVNHEVQLQHFNQGQNRNFQQQQQQMQLQRMANLQNQFIQQHQQFQPQPPPQQQQQWMQGYDGYGPIQPQQQQTYPQDLVSQRILQNTVRLSNSFSHQNLTQLDYGQGRFNYNGHNQVGQAADWPLMSSRQTQFYDNSYYGDLNQYSLLPPIAKDDAPQFSSRPRDDEGEITTTDKAKPKIRAQSENLYLKDRQNMFQQQLQQDPGSYMASYVNSMTKVNKVTSYKPYTLKDFRQLKKEIQSLSKVGGLGPDLESDHVRLKAERQNRRLKYAQFVQEVNSHALDLGKEPNSPQLAQQPSDEWIRRQKLLEYAKNVPKPKVKRVKAEAQQDERNRRRKNKPEPEDVFLAFQMRQAEQNQSHHVNKRSTNSVPGSTILQHIDDPDDGFLAFAHADPGEQAAIDEMRRRHEQDKQLAYNNSGGNGSGRRSNRESDGKQVRFVGSGVGNTPKS